VAARIISSSKPRLGITLQADGTPLDNGSGLANAYYRGGFSSLVDITNDSRTITLHPPVRVNYGSSDEQDLRKIGRFDFVTIPASEELIAKHELTAERMFQAHNDHGSSTLGPDDVKPGDKFRISLNIRQGFTWWHFGSLDDDLKDKKFIGLWEEPEEDGRYKDFDDIDGQKPDAEDLERHGWVFSEKLDDLKMTAEDGKESVVIEFVE
jgi:hypothetical protein